MVIAVVVFGFTARRSAAISREVGTRVVVREMGVGTPEYFQRTRHKHVDPTTEETCWITIETIDRTVMGFRRGGEPPRPAIGLSR